MIKKTLMLLVVFIGLFALVACNGDNSSELLEEALADLSVASEVSSDLVLPTSGENDVVISWVSDKPEVIANDGTVTRPSAETGNVTVVLTATLTLGEEELTKTFPVVVLANEPLDPIEALTLGHFVYSFFEAGYGSFTSFFTFYEDDPVLGAVFYYGGSNNRVNTAGTYTVEEVEIEYALYEDRAAKLADEVTTGTAPYTISFYDFDGNLIDQAGYDGEIVYNDMENSLLAASGTNEHYYTHDTDENSEFVTIYEGEAGIPYVELVNPNDEAASLSINHNKTYTDLIGEFIVEGTWTVSDGDAGALEFALVPHDSYDTGATVVLNSDQTAATYTADGSTDTIDLVIPVEGGVDERTLLFDFTSDKDDRSLSLFDDGTWEFNIPSMSVVETGTFTYTGYTLTLVQEDETEIVATMDGTTHAYSIAYVALAHESLTGTFTVESSVWGAIFGADGEWEPALPEAAVLFEGTSAEEGKTLTFYDDGTWEFNYSAYSIVETGTFTYTGYSLTLTQSNDEEIVATMDGSTYELSIAYVTVAGDGAISATFTVASSVWGAAFGSDGEWVPEGTPVVALTFTGTHEASLTITIIVNLYDDNSVEIIQDMGAYGSSVLETGTYVVTGSSATTSYDITVDSGTYHGVLNSTYSGLEFTYSYTLPASMGGTTVDVLVEAGLPTA